MPLIPVDNIGSAGVIRDLWAPDTPPEAWSWVRNVRMGPHGAEKFLGHRATLGTAAGLELAVDSPFYWMAYIPVADSNGYWVISAGGKLYSLVAQNPYVDSNITRLVGGDYTNSLDKRWGMYPFNGMMLMHNQTDAPQVWVPGAANATDLANWPAGLVCRSLKGFGSYLVALGETDGATEYPTRVRWSHPADPGSMPSWDETDPTLDAGFYDALDVPGHFVDQFTLRGEHLLYSTDRIMVMQEIGGNDIFSIRPRISSAGALAQHCVTPFKKNADYHLVLSGDDIFVHNGQSPESILDPRMRRWFFSQIDTTNYRRSYVVENKAFSEVWVCIPTQGAEYPNLALVWNWLENTLSFRDLRVQGDDFDSLETDLPITSQGFVCMAAGKIEDDAHLTWATATDTWATTTMSWAAARQEAPYTTKLLALSGPNLIVYAMDSGSTFFGSRIPYILEREGIALIGQDRSGKPKSDGQTIKQLTEIWPRFDAPVGTEIEIAVGLQDVQDQAPVWYNEGTYTVGTDEFKSVYHTARFFSIRFSTYEISAHRALGYSLRIDPTGLY